MILLAPKVHSRAHRYVVFTFCRRAVSQVTQRFAARHVRTLLGAGRRLAELLWPHPAFARRSFAGSNMGVDNILSCLAGEKPGNGSPRPGIFDVALVGGVSGAEGHGFLIAVDLSSVLHSLPQRHRLPVILGNYADAAAAVVATAMKYKIAGVILVFVSDCRLHAYGPKADEDKARQELRAAAAAKVLAAPMTAPPDLVRDAFDVSKLQLDVEKALAASGFTVVTAPREADPQMVRMWDERVVDGIWACDGDLFVHGAERLIWGGSFFSGPIQKVTVVHTPSMTSPDASLQFLRSCPDAQARRTLYRFFAILAGCDYFKLDGVSSGIAAQAVRRLHDKVLQAAEPGAFAWSRLHEPGIAGDHGMLAELLRQVLDVSPQLRRQVDDGSVTASRGDISDGVLRGLERAYYAFASSPVYSFLYRDVRVMDVEPPTDALREHVGVSAAQLESMNDALAIFHGSAESANWWGKTFLYPRTPGAELCDASRYTFGVRFTHFYITARCKLGPKAHLGDDLQEWLQASRNTRSGAPGSSQADLVVAVNGVIASERNAAHRRRPALRPKDWRPAAMVLRGGPLLTPAHRRRLLLRARDAELPAHYDASADAIADRDADDAARRAVEPVPIVNPAAVAGQKRTRLTSLIDDFPKPLSIQFFKDQ